MDIIFKLSEKNRDRWDIFVENQKWREVHRTIFGRNPKFPPHSIEGDVQSVFDDLEYRQAKKYVLWRLSAQSYHSEQLRKLLRDRLVQNQTIDRLLQEFQCNGILDDELWIQNFMQTQKKKHSMRAILFKLRSKGFSSETIQKLTQEWNNPADELKAIQLLIQTRYKNKDLSDYKTKRNVFASLIRKGYSFDQINDSLKKL